MKLPEIKPNKIVKVLFKLGFKCRPGKGSHQVFSHADGRRTTIPIHNRPIRKGTLRAILNQIEISKEEFLKYL